MKSRMAWRVAKKDFRMIVRKKSIIGYTVGLPIVMAIAFSLVVRNSVVGANVPEASLGLASLTYVFVILSAVLPTSIAAYSIVGEKVEKSLEPLLATPTTDGELLLGKEIAAFLPGIVSIWVGAGIFMGATDYLTYGTFSGYYFPSWVPGIELFLLAPLAAMLGVEVAVVLSSRVTDVRGANQLAGLMYLPFMVAFFAGVDGFFPMDVESLLIMSGVVLASDVAMLFFSTATFSREEMLTKWK
jgi:ABC-2 type transport system permease protein